MTISSMSNYSTHAAVGRHFTYLFFNQWEDLNSDLTFSYSLAVDFLDHSGYLIPFCFSWQLCKRNRFGFASVYKKPLFFSKLALDHAVFFRQITWLCVSHKDFRIQQDHFGSTTRKIYNHRFSLLIYFGPIMDWLKTGLKSLDLKN